MGFQKDEVLGKDQVDLEERPRPLIQTHAKAPNIGYIWIAGTNFGKQGHWDLPLEWERIDIVKQCVVSQLSWLNFYLWYDTLGHALPKNAKACQRCPVYKQLKL